MGPLAMPIQAAPNHDCSGPPPGSLADMCRDHWRWQSSNPEGFEKARAGDAKDGIHESILRGKSMWF